MATILIVDDRPSNREVLASLLSYQKHRLLEAEDGRQALGLARRDHPDLVISDIRARSRPLYRDALLCLANNQFDRLWGSRRCRYW